MALPRLARLAAVLLSVGAAGCASLVQQPPAELRVLVYNIHAGKDAGGKDNLERVAALVRESRADLVLLQEVDRGTTRSGGVDQLAVLRERTGMEAAFGRTLWYQGGGYGIALLSRFPILAHRVVELPNDPPQPRGGGSREPRGALHAVVQSPIGRLHVVNTHIDASAQDTWRRQEAGTLVRLTDSLVRTGTPLLLGGDMNSTPESAVQELVRRGKLRDAWVECGRGEELTFPAAKPVKRIDYLYLTGGISCTEASVVATDASDHRPLLTVVRVPHPRR